MAKDDLISAAGKVMSLSGGGIYIIELENGSEIRARLCGKMKRFKIKVVVGDSVTVGVSPYDLTLGLITHRAKN
ncbi:MAG: translation initiation factor IF-1 [Bdellovibrionales bacterium]|nr:translation initiation factor IF-1 [Bdellovibrionales bacterium]